MPKTKPVRRWIGFAQFSKFYIRPDSALLRYGADLQAGETQYIALEIVRRDLPEATKLTDSLPGPGLQNVLCMQLIREPDLCFW